MKVLMITPGGLEHGGGIGRMIGYMLEAWRPRKDAPQFTVVDTRGPGRLDLALIFFAAALGRIVLSRLQGRPMLHVHLAGRGSTLRKIIVVHLADLLRLPVVLHLHDYNYAAFVDSLPPIGVALVKSMVRRSLAVVVLGERDRALMIERFGVDPGRAHIVPNSVPRPASADSDPDMQSGAPVQILFLGNPSRRKGVHDLLASLAAMAHPPSADAAPWRAVIAGGGKEVGAFEAMASELGLAETVSFPGWLSKPDVERLLRQSQILVLPSYDEGLAMSVLEGMSHGLCVICTPVGALREVIVHDQSGWLFAPGDRPALSAALLACVADAELRGRLGKGAAQRFSEVYDVADYPNKISVAYGFTRRVDPAAGDAFANPSYDQAL